MTPRWRAVGSFRLNFQDPSVMVDKVRGEPVYLILDNADKTICMKPQNLLTGLPVRRVEAVS